MRASSILAAVCVACGGRPAPLDVEQSGPVEDAADAAPGSPDEGAPAEDVTEDPGLPEDAEPDDLIEPIDSVASELPPEDTTAPDTAKPELFVSEALGVAIATPNPVSARGGQDLTILGHRFTGPSGLALPAVTLADVPLELISFTADTLVVRAPRIIAGTYPLLVSTGAASATLPGGLVVAPLDLEWLLAAAELADAPEAEVRDAVPFDVEPDGDIDLVLATSQGLELLLNDGEGRLSLAREPSADPFVPGPVLRPGGRGDTYALATANLDGDDNPELIVCTGAATELRFQARNGQLDQLGGFPLRDTGCRDIVVLDGDGDGIQDVLTLVETATGQRGLSFMRNDGKGVLTQDAFTSPALPDPLIIGTATSADPAAVVSFGRTREAVADGEAAGEMMFALTEVGPEAVFTLARGLPWAPDRVRLSLAGDGSAVTVRLRLVDATGATFDSPPQTPTSQLWGPVDLQGVGTWTPVGWTAAAPEDVPPNPVGPITTVAFVVATNGALPLAGTVWVDAVVADRADEMSALADDFERRVLQHIVSPAVGLTAGDFDGDGKGDILVLPGETAPVDTAPVLFSSLGAPGDLRWSRAFSPTGGPGPFPTAAIVDADSDGHDDLVLPSGTARDRLLLGDGFGHFLDVTAGTMPFDWAAARTIATADVDLDGHIDLVIGNVGAAIRLYLGQGDGRFFDKTPLFGFDIIDMVVIVPVDLESDGDYDVVIVPRTGRPTLRIAVEDP